jgi:hypothetical protein
MYKIRMGVGIMAYLVADFSPGLQGLRGAFLALFCNPASPNESAPDLGRSSVVEVLRGVSADETAPMSGDLVSSSSSSTLIVSTPKLTISVSIDTAGPVLFRFFFLASAVWVTTIVDAARKVDILPVVCLVRRGADVATLGGGLLVVGASSSLPIVESEIYSLMHYCKVICASAATQTL